MNKKIKPVNLRDIFLRIKKKISENTTRYEIIQEYDVKVREDGSYYYENDNGEVIELLF